MKKVKTPTNVVVFYNAFCFDGFGAAYAAYSVYGDQAMYLQCNSETELPMNILVGKDVFLVDFSYKRDQLTTLSRIARTVTVIDHRVSSEKELVGGIANNVEVVYDVRKSGAVLTWEYLHNLSVDPVPDLLKHIQDRTLEWFVLPKTRKITEALQREELEFKVWMKFVNKGCGTLAKGRD